MAIQVVSFHCTLKNMFGRVISSTYNQGVLTCGDDPAVPLKALSDALQDLRKGERRKISLHAQEAYGFYNPELVVVRPIDEITMSGPVKLNEHVVYVQDGKKKIYRVTEITGDSVTLDANHPLAGQDLVFEIEATDARAATAEEIAGFEPEFEGRLLH